MIQHEPDRARIDTAQRRCEQLRSRISAADPFAALALEELGTGLEELRVGEEELRAQNESLAESRQRLEAEQRRSRELFALAPDAYLVTDADGLIRDANAAAAVLLRVSEERLVGKPLSVFIAPDGQRAFRSRLGRLGQTGRAERWELPVQPREGERVPAEATAGASADESGATVVRWLIRDLSEREQAEHTARQLAGEAAARREAEEARAEAERANRAKSAFLANMSHELRTPINAIVGYADLLEMGIAGPLTEGQRLHLHRIRTSSEHLTGLIEEVLDLARVESGRMTVAREPGRLAEAVHAALALVGPQAAAGGLRVEDRCGADRSTYTGDPLRVRQILVNLLSNAAKFTEPGGQLRVECGVSAGPEPTVARLAGGELWTYVFVEDTGIGIAPEKTEAVWEPFVQAEEGHTRPRGGTGLGLAISRELARLMGGELTLRSEVGRGSRFTLWLPTAAPAPLRRPAPAETEASLHRELAEVGTALQGDIPAILAALVAHLRSDPAVPGAAGLSDAELEDHIAPFLADITQSLSILGRTVGEPALLRDGSDIQRLIAERHGAQRARFGWSEEGLAREFELLREEVTETVRRLAVDSDGADAAAGVLDRLLQRAGAVSRRGLRQARAAEESA